MLAAQNIGVDRTMRIHAVAESRDPIREAREDLAVAYRGAAHFRFDDTIWNHFTLRLPGQPHHFLVKPHGLLFSEVTAENLIVVDTEGRTVEGRGTAERTAVCIHAAIHQAIERATCVLHVHPPYATWLATIDGGRLLPVNQDSLRFYNRISYDDYYNGVALDHDEGRRIAGLFQKNNVLLLANHGVIVIGPTVAEAFYNLYYLELSCEQQYKIACAGRAPRLVAPDIAERTARCFDDDKEGPVDFLAAMKRLLGANPAERAR